MRGWIGIVTFVLVSTIGAGAARADNKVAAEEAFLHAKELEKQGKQAEACDEFARSQELDPQLGTEYNLALCYEKVGKTASAWAMFREVAQRDTKAARKKDASKRAKNLGDRLTKVLITIDGPAIPGLVVKLNGEDVTATLGVATAIDPGDYALEAGAPDRQSFTSTVTASGEGAVVTVTIPALAEVEAERPEEEHPPEEIRKQPPPEEPDEPPAAGGGGRKKLGMIVTGAGAAITAVGAVFGVLARGKWNTASDVCGSDMICDSQADLDRSRSLASDARTFGNVATGLVIGGVATAAVGVVLWLTAPSGSPPEEQALRVVPSVDGDGVYVSIGGAL